MRRSSSLSFARTMCDHTAGNSSFPPGATYVVHPTSKAILDRQAAGSGARPDAWRLPESAKLVADSHTIVLGGEQVQILFLGRAHTGGDLSVYLPKRGILFLSETFLNRAFPAMRSAYPSEWLRSLTKAEQMDVDIYIPGHGFTEGAEVSKDELRNAHRALEAVIAEATRLHKSGVPLEQAVREADFSEYRSWTLAASQGPIAVRKVYEELDGQLKE